MIRVEVDQTADWHDFPTTDLLLIANLVLKALNGPVKVPRAPWPHVLRLINGPPGPQVLCGPGDTVRIRVYLEDVFPVRLCYQLAHEWGHVLSNNWRSFNPGPFHWLEESICGAVSLCALRHAQTSWRNKPSLRPYVESVESFVSETDESKCPLATAEIPNWVRINDLALRSTKTLAQINSRLSVPLFAKLCSSPILIRSLQARNRSLSPEVDVGDHLHNWAEQCRMLGISARFPEELTTLFDADKFLLK